MGFFKICASIEDAEELVGVIAEYIDINCTDFIPHYGEIDAYNKWITENCSGIVAGVYEQQFDKEFLVLLFRDSEDAVGFKLAWL